MSQYIPKIYFGEAGYLEAVKDILTYGTARVERTGVGTKALFQLQFRYDVGAGFPLLTTKKMGLRLIFEELMWFLRGQTDVKLLKEKNVHIWDGNSTREFLDKVGLKNLPEDDIGASYGFQFRHAGAVYTNSGADYSGKGIDQVKEVIQLLKTDPHNRRIMISLWNVAQLKEMALPPCLCLYHFFVVDKKLSLGLYQRSGDMGLGVPFNIASASLLLHIIARECQLVPHELIHTIGDCHVYNNHAEALTEQVARIPFPLPSLEFLNQHSNFEEYEFKDIRLNGYQSHPAINMEMAV